MLVLNSIIFYLSEKYFNDKLLIITIILEIEHLFQTRMEYYY